MNIFYSHLLGDYAIDEMCFCGHLKSEHGSKVIKLKEDNKMLRDSHAGSCCGSSCDCKKFRFERHVGVEEAAEIAISKRPLSV